METINFNRVGSMKSITPSPYSHNMISDNNRSSLELPNKTQIRKVLFLQKILIFSNLAYKELSRLSAIFFELKLRKNQVLFKESFKAEQFFIIKRGEFKLIKSRLETFHQPSQSLSSIQLNSLQHSRVFGLKIPKIKEVPIVIKTENELLAGEELFSRLEDYQHTCICLSNEAEVLVAEVSEFRLKARQQDIWNKLSLLVSANKANYEKRANCYKNVEELKESKVSNNYLNKSESFRKNQGILRKLSPARDMLNSHYVSVEDRRKAQKQEKLFNIRADFPVLAKNCLKNAQLTKRIFGF